MVRINSRVSAMLLILLAGAAAGGCASERAVEVDDSRSPKVVALAADAGVDLRDGNPQRNRTRLLGVHEAGRTADFSTIRLDGGVYIDRASGMRYTGYAATAYASGAPRSIHGIVDGRLEGPGMWFFEDGSIWIATRYHGSEMRSQILEFFESGPMKLRAMAYEVSPRGGIRVEEITVGTFGDDGYERRQLGKGRMQMIRPDGTTDRTNATIAVPDQSGYMLFYERMIGGERAYTTDSRDIPDASHGA
ncbi:MAG: hypothetical protein AAFX05_07475 [Planctomycetota bacterium]